MSARDCEPAREPAGPTSLANQREPADLTSLRACASLRVREIVTRECESRVCRTLRTCRVLRECRVPRVCGSQGSVEVPEPAGSDEPAGSQKPERCRLRCVPINLFAGQLPGIVKLPVPSASRFRQASRFNQASRFHQISRYRQASRQVRLRGLRMVSGRRRVSGLCGPAGRPLHPRGI